MPAPFKPPPLTDEERRTVEANLGLVGFTLRLMGVDPDEYDDRRQDGALGLMRAVQLYDPSKGTLGNYAFKHIRDAIDRGRGRELGADYRHARRYGKPWHRPIVTDDLRTLDRAAPSHEPSALAQLHRAGLSDGEIEILIRPYGMTAWRCQRHLSTRQYRRSIARARAHVSW